MKYKTLATGDTGSTVKTLQGILGVSQDGIFGRITCAAVERFQQEHGLYVDGVVGPITWASLLAHSGEAPALEPWVRVPVTKYKKGYASLTLRESTAGKLKLASDKLYGYGGILTSSGGKRSLSAAVGANRSRTSLHYTGRAFDLYMWSGMINPDTDPYVVTLDSEKKRLWRVYAACENASELEVEAWTYSGDKKLVKRKLVDLTSLLSEFQFSPIPARRSFFRGGSRGAAEWWHFQDIEGLVKGSSKFGDELSKVWPESKLVVSPVWAYKDYTWKTYGFSRG